MGGVYRFSPVIDGNGTVYTIGSGTLYTINPDGSLRWSKRIFNPVASPSIGPDGTIYVPAARSIAAFSPSGTLKWNISTLTNINLGASLTISPTGQIYSENSGTIYSINPNGQTSWSLATNCVTSAPAIGQNGRVYCGGGRTLGGVLYSIDPVGAIVWTFSTGSNDRIDLAPTVGADGTIYVPSANGTLYAVSPTGLLQWKYNIHSVNASTIIGPSGMIYAASQNLTAFMPGGFISWTKSCYFNPADSSCTPFGTINGMAVDSTGTLFVMNAIGNSSSILALNPSDGSYKWSYALPFGETPESPPAIAPDGAIYLGTSCGRCMPGVGPGHLYSFGIQAGYSLITARESGLPNGTVWSAIFDGKTYQGNGPTMTYSVPPGNHSWTANATAGQLRGVRYVAVNGSGTLQVPSSTAFYVTYSKQYEVLGSAVPPLSGSASIQTGWYAPLSNVSVSAKANSGYAFGLWSSNSTAIRFGNTSAVTTTLFINGTGTIFATFYPGLTIVAGTGGSVTFDAPPLRGTVPAGTNKTIFVPRGTSVILQAQPNPDYSFVGWTGTPSGQGTLIITTVQVNSPVSLIGGFAIQSTSTKTTTSSPATSTGSTSLTTTTAVNSTTTLGPPSPRFHLTLFDYELIAGVLILAVVIGYLFVQRSSGGHEVWRRLRASVRRALRNVKARIVQGKSGI